MDVLRVERNKINSLIDDFNEASMDYLRYQGNVFTDPTGEYEVRLRILEAISRITAYIEIHKKKYREELRKDTEHLMFIVEKSRMINKIRKDIVDHFNELDRT